MNTSTEENARKDDRPNADDPGQEAPVADGDTALPENGAKTGASAAAPHGDDAFPADPADPTAPGDPSDPDDPNAAHDDDAYAFAAAPKGSAAPKEGGVLSAETFAITAVMLTVLSLIGTRVGQMLSSVTASPTDQLSSVTNLILGDASTALLGVVLGGVSLILYTSASRPWARWAAAAAIILGVIAVVSGGAAIMLLPEPQPMQPGMAPGM